MATEYRIKEMVLTLQGEGAMTGTAVVLLRFEGCNLECDFCDTDFTGTDGENGGIFRTAAELAEAVQQKWISSTQLNVLCTGGEPLMQLDAPLVEEFHTRGFKILIETNGTIPAPEHIDWICVSPKTEEIPLLHRGDEIKIVWPQKKTDPKKFEELEFNHFWIQPKYDEHYKKNLRASIEYCLAHPRWRLSLQTHRYTGIS